MKTENRIEAKVEKTLASLDELENIECSPFFNTRLMAKLDETPPVSTGRSPLWILSYSIAILLIAFNTWSFFQNEAAPEPTSASNNYETGVELFTQEYFPQSQSNWKIMNY
jgi:hypothetical protein